VNSEHPYRFLVALGQALSAAQLYDPGHPARGRAAEEVWRRARELLSATPHASFTFLEGEVAFGDRRVRSLQDWPWARDFYEAGIERIELTGGLRQEHLEACLLALERRLSEDGPAEPWTEEGHHIRFGPLEAEEEAELRAELEERMDDVEQLFREARSDGIVSAEVAEAVVGEVARAIRQSGNLLKLLVPLKEVDQYSTVHSMNVSVLSIGFAEQQGFQGSDVKRVGESALLHDVGKSLIPEEILQKPGALTDREWEIMQQHPEDGARILLRAEKDGVLPAVVAYEHHMYLDGSGYPPRIFPRSPHPVSQLVQICDVFDALRTRRPFRGPWPAEKIILHLNEGAGNRFHSATVESFVSMIRQWDAVLSDGAGGGEGPPSGPTEGAAAVAEGPDDAGAAHAPDPERDAGDGEHPG
jgi:HD-GYP domain-containing protein (c-di-GMP phosphodiesterase class II)